MSIAEEIKNIDTSSATGAGVFFFSLLGPGLLTVFLFQRGLFVELDTLKLSILSLSISAPGVIVPIFITVIAVTVFSALHQIDKSFLGVPREWFYRHGIGNAINMYFLIFLAYIFKWPFLWFAWGFLASIIVMCIFEIRYLSKRAKDPKKYPPVGLM